MKKFFHFKLLFFPAKSTIQLFLLSHLCDIEDLYYYQENYWRIKKESLSTTTSSKEKVFHWHVPHLQQKASRDGKKNKGKQPISLAVCLGFFCHQKKVI